MVGLQPVDAVEVTLVVDDVVDILVAGGEGARRFPLAHDVADHERLARAMPEAFVQPSVGTTLRF